MSDSLHGLQLEQPECYPACRNIVGRFSMIPVRNDGTTKFNTNSEKFEKWKTKTKVVLMSEKSKAWYEKHKNSVEDKRVKYWGKWMQKSAEDISARTLNAGDGI